MHTNYYFKMTAWSIFIIVMLIGCQSKEIGEFLTPSSQENMYSTNGIIGFKKQADFDEFIQQNTQFSDNDRYALEKKFGYTSIQSVKPSKNTNSSSSIIYAGPTGALLNENRMIIINSVLYQFEPKVVKSIELDKKTNILQAIAALQANNNSLSGSIKSSEIVFQEIPVKLNSPNARLGQPGATTVSTNQSCVPSPAPSYPDACLWADGIIQLGVSRQIQTSFVFMYLTVNRRANFDIFTCCGSPTPYTAVWGGSGNITINGLTFSGGGFTSYSLPFTYNVTNQPTETMINLYYSSGLPPSNTLSNFTGNFNFTVNYLHPLLIGSPYPVVSYSETFM